MPVWVSSAGYTLLGDAREGAIFQISGDTFRERTFIAWFILLKWSTDVYQNIINSLLDVTSLTAFIK